MSVYPPDVEVRVKFLDEYKVNEKLNCFDIFHLYPKGLAYPNGYYDSQFFEIIAFNTEKMEKRNFGSNHDEIDFWEGCVISKAQVYADGAYLIKFSHFVEAVGNSQMFCVKPCAG